MPAVPQAVAQGVVGAPSIAVHGNAKTKEGTVELEQDIYILYLIAK